MQGLLDRAGVDTVGVVTSSLPTISKTRIVGRMQQLLRLDIESRDTPPAAEMDRLIERATSLVEKVHAVVLSDYAKGALSRLLCESVHSRGTREGEFPCLQTRRLPTSVSIRARRRSVPISANSRLRPGFRRTRRRLFWMPASFRSLSMGFEFLTVTMSEKGIGVLWPERRYHSPARAREVFDVSGAGDTVIATIAARPGRRSSD